MSIHPGMFGALLMAVLLGFDGVMWHPIQKGKVTLSIPLVNHQASANGDLRVVA
jgi:hypothetical protein